MQPKRPSEVKLPPQFMKIKTAEKLPTESNALKAEAKIAKDTGDNSGYLTRSDSYLRAMDSIGRAQVAKTLEQAGLPQSEGLADVLTPAMHKGEMVLTKLSTEPKVRQGSKLKPSQPESNG